MCIRRIELRPVLNRARQEAERVRKIAAKQLNRTRKSLKKTFSKKRNQRRAVYIGGAILIGVLASGLVVSHTKAQSTQKEYQQHIDNKDVELNERELLLKSHVEALQKLRKQKAVTETELKEKARKEAELKREIDELNRQLQAKKKTQARLASVTRPTPQPVYSGGSGCEWLKGRLAANGVSQSDIPAAISIASKESGCNPSAVNPSSGACNVFQEYTCGKWGGRYNVDAHIRGASAYARDVYGGWWGAYNAWQTQRWW